MNHAPWVFERFHYRGLLGCQCFCRLELLPLVDGRALAIATELEDNPGTSITNVAEHLASYVCDRFSIDPDRLVWIETYGYPAPNDRAPTYDRVTFTRRSPEGLAWFLTVTRGQPDGWPGYFQEPDWRMMKDEHWKSMGLEPRR